MEQETESSRPGSRQGGSRTQHTSLLLASAACTTIAALLACSYALWNGIAVLGGLGLQLLLAALGVWAAMHGLQVRKRFSEASDAESPSADALATRRRYRWGDRDYEPQPQELRQALLEDATHSRHVHFLFLEFGPVVLIGVIAVYFLTRVGPSEEPIAQTAATVFGLLCLAASCAWIVFARSYEALAEEDFSGAGALALVFRETQWASLLGAAGLLGSLMWAPLQHWVARVLVVWIVAICIEQLVRAIIAWRHVPSAGEDPVPLRPLAFRQSLLVHGNPLTSLFEAFERRFGVSFRSSWTIRFVRRAFLPVLLVSGLLYWGLTSLTLIGPSERGVRESFGVVDGQLGPGLHWKLPWPFGQVRRFDVKRIRSVRIGSNEEESKHRPTAILWSKAHAHEEFALVLGTGTEAVSIGALLYYKICEDREGFLDYVYHTQNPIDALQGYAMRALMEHTRSATLEEVLSVDRAEYANRLEEDLRQYVARNRLGVEIVDLALINQHPPVAAAAAYLDVISAEIDAVRFQFEAEGEKKTRIQEAETESGRTIADGKVRSAKRVGLATEESAQFVTVGQAFSVAPEAFKLRMSGDTVSEILGSKPLTLIDPAFVDGEGEMMLDLRPGTQRSDAAELR